MSQLVIRIKSKKPLEEAVKDMDEADVSVNEAPFRKINTVKQTERKEGRRPKIRD